MPHDMPLISALVVGLVLAFLLGLAANRLRMPPLVGYLLAGIVVGPHAFGLAADPAMGGALAAFGIILLMFGVGLHFSLRDLMGVRVLALVGALAQLAFTTLLGLGVALLMGWSVGAGLLFGLALSSASAVVVFTALKDQRLLATESGQIVSGWLIVQGIAMVLVLVLLPATADLYGTNAGIHDPFVSFLERLVGGPVGLWGALGLTIIKIAAFIGFMLIVGRRAIPWALHGAARIGSRELFTLAVLAMGLGLALGSSLVFGVPLALGAFLAGMIFSESRPSHRAATEALPLREAFSVLFFLAVGMMIDPAIILANPLAVIATLLVIVLGKAMAAYGVVSLFGRPVDMGVTASAATAQIGEFSFILASMGVALAILPDAALELVVGGIVISILVNPLVFWSLRLMRPRLAAQPAGPERGTGSAELGEPALAANGAASADIASAVSDHVVLVGYGAVGRVVADGLGKVGTPLVVIVDSAADAAAARQAGLDVVVGHAASRNVLQSAGLERARTLLVAIGDSFAAGAVCRSGRKLNPKIRILAQAASEDEDAHLRRLGADVIVRGEHEIGLGLLAWLRGERSDETPPAAPAGPVFGPVENLLEKAAAAPAVAATVAVPVVAEAAVEAGAVAVEPVPEAEAEPAAGTTPDPAPVAPDDPVIIAAVESASPPDVIAMPPPTPPAQDGPATEPESVETLPETGQKPAAGEATTQPAPAAADETWIPDPAEPEPATGESLSLDPPAEPEEDLAAPEPAEKPADAEPVTPPAEPAPEPDAPQEADEDKPGGVVPPVVPEPKP